VLIWKQTTFDWQSGGGIDFPIAELKAPFDELASEDASGRLFLFAISPKTGEQMTVFAQYSEAAAPMSMRFVSSPMSIVIPPWIERPTDIALITLQGRSIAEWPLVFAPYLKVFDQQTSEWLCRHYHLALPPPPTEAPPNATGIVITDVAFDGCPATRMPAIEPPRGYSLVDRVRIAAGLLPVADAHHDSIRVIVTPAPPHVGKQTLVIGFVWRPGASTDAVPALVRSAEVKPNDPGVDAGVRDASGTLAGGDHSEGNPAPTPPVVVATSEQSKAASPTPDCDLLRINEVAVSPKGDSVVFDVTMHNVGSRIASVTRADLEILQAAPAREPLAATGKYPLMLQGRTNQVTFSHTLEPDKVDRIQIVAGADGNYAGSLIQGRLRLKYNRSCFTDAEILKFEAPASPVRK